jgi:thrombospondin motif-containing protein 9
VTYSWKQNVPYGTCSTNCGGGTQTRPLQCIDNGGTVVPNSNCNGQAQPATQQACSTQACPVDWQIGTWTTWYSPLLSFVALPYLR